MNSNLFLNIVFTDEYRFSIEINFPTMMRMREKTTVRVRENVDDDFFLSLHGDRDEEPCSDQEFFIAISDIPRRMI